MIYESREDKKLLSRFSGIFEKLVNMFYNKEDVNSIKNPNFSRAF